MSNETKPGAVDLDVLCAVCGERYGDHYGPFCDHSDKRRLFGDRAFVPAEPAQQASDELEDMKLASEMLMAYAECIKENVGYKEIERWHYTPQIEEIAGILAALAANQKGAA